MIKMNLRCLNVRHCAEDEAAVDEDAVDEVAVDEDAVDEDAVDEAAVDEAAVDEAAVDEAAVVVDFVFVSEWDDSGVVMKVWKFLFFPLLFVVNATQNSNSKYFFTEFPRQKIEKKASQNDEE